MTEWFTLADRRAATLWAMRVSVDALRGRLAAFARAHDGRFVLFGSAARDAMKPDSDVDILVDFPPETLADAWRFAERACWDLCLDPDIQPYPDAGSPLLARIASEAVVLA